MAKNTRGNAAAQEAAAPTTTAAVETNTAPVATFKISVKALPKARVRKEKQPKEPKRLTGRLTAIALCSYNHWRQFVNFGINGDESIMPVSAWRKAIGALKHKTKTGEIVDTKWGGYIAVTPSSVEAVTTMLNNFTTNQATLPEAERAVSMWEMLETPFTIEPAPRKPRAKKVKAAAETTEVAEA
jgi:hypothetical protein